MNITEQAELIIREAESKLAVLANEYARNVIHPFCDKYGLIFAQYDYDWNFYFNEAEKTGKYPYAIDNALLNFLKTGDKEETYHKYATSLSELSYEFRYSLEEIIRNIDGRLCDGVYLPLGRYIPRYPTVQ
jgi:hypothetical protein